jgi:tetratricopeptide (TPR) repeat protein
MSVKNPALAGFFIGLSVRVIITKSCFDYDFESTFRIASIALTLLIVRQITLLIFLVTTLEAFSEVPLRQTHEDTTVYSLMLQVNLAEEAQDWPAFAEASIRAADQLRAHGSVERALELLIRAESVIEEKYPDMNAKIKLMLGELHLLSRQPELSYIYLRQAHYAFQKLGHPAGLATSLSTLGHFFEKNGSYDSALHYQFQALELYRSLKDDAGMAQVHENLGSIYEDLGNYTLARPNFERALELNNQMGKEEQAIVNLNNIGDMYRKTKDADQALGVYNQVLIRSKKLNLVSQVRSAYRDLGKTLADKGQFSLAYAYLDSCYEVNKLLFTDEIARELAKTRSLFELQQKDQRIALLEKEQQLSKINRIGLLVVACLLTIIAGLILYHLRTRLRKNRRIYEAELGYKKLQEEKLYRELESRGKELTTNALHIIQKNEFLEELKKQLKELKKVDEVTSKKIKKIIRSIDHNFSLDDDWQEFEMVFQQVHADFFEKLRVDFPNLTPADVRLCAMLRLNLSSKDIATIMGISQDSLRIARYRLRKKLDIDKGGNLYSYIMTLG